MPPGQSFTELAQFNQASAWIILKIAFCELTKVGKIEVQTIKEVEVAIALIHRIISAGNALKKQCYIDYNSTPAALPVNSSPSRT